MTTMLFHRMKIDPIHQTPIQIVPSQVRQFCYRCHRLVTPNVIITAFLSLPLDVCPHCCTVIQHVNGNGNGRKK